MRWFGFRKRWESPHDFEWKVLKAFRKRCPKRPVFLDWLEHALRFGDRPYAWVNLGDAYWTYSKSAQADRPKMIAAIVAESGAQPRIGRDEAIPRLMVSILGFDAGADPALSDVPRRQVAGPWTVALFLDGFVVDGFVTEGQLRDWGFDFDEALDVALANLRKRDPLEFVRDDDGFYLAAAYDHQESSRVLLPETFNVPVKGDPIAVAVSRHALCVAGSDEPDALIAMAEFVDRRMSAVGEPISYQPMRLANGSWAPVKAEEPFPVSLQWLRVKQTFWQYFAQRRILLEDEERDFHGAYLSEVDIRDDDASAGTWTTWVSGLPTLLAKTDGLAMRNEAGEDLFRSWDDVISVCGRFVPEPDLFPIRYRVESGPTSEQWRRLQSEFTEPTWSKYPSGIRDAIEQSERE